MQKQISCGKERKKGKMQKILVVEDDWEMNQGICYVLRENGYETACAYSVSEGKEAFDAGGADLVLLDVNLPDGEGFGFCGWLRGKIEDREHRYISNVYGMGYQWIGQ